MSNFLRMGSTDQVGTRVPMREKIRKGKLMRLQLERRRKKSQDILLVINSNKI